MIDAIATEGHFADHIAPIWLALPPEVRGTLYLRAPRDLPNVVIGPAPMSRNPTLVAAAGDLKRGRGRRNAMMEHGCGQSFGGDPRTLVWPSYAGGLHRDAELFLHPGPHPAGRDRARYPAARVEVVGCAKLDSLPRRDRDGPPVVAVSFHWNCTICAETEPAFASFGKQLATLVKSYQVIGHGHPRILRRLRAAYHRLGIETVASFEEVCRRADLYVNDCLIDAVRVRVHRPAGRRHELEALPAQGEPRAALLGGVDGRRQRRA